MFKADWKEMGQKFLFLDNSVYGDSFSMTPVFLSLPIEFVDGTFHFYLHAHIFWDIETWSLNLPKVLLTNEYQEPILEVIIDVLNQTLILSSSRFMVRVNTSFHTM